MTRGVRGARARGQPGRRGRVFRAGGGGGKEAVPVADEREPHMAAPRVQGRGEMRQAGAEARGSRSERLACEGSTPYVRPLTWGH